MIERQYENEVVSRKEARERGLLHYFTGRPCINGHLSIRGVLSKSCAECMKDVRRRWLERNREAERVRSAAWKKANPEKERLRHAAGRLKEGFREAKRVADKLRWEEKRDIRLLQKASWRRQKRQECPSFRFKDNLRRRIRIAYSGRTKPATTIDLIGCSHAEFMKHIESRFAPGMSWENRSEWHVDHIVPVSIFDISDPDQARLAFHYSNCQPLWAADNLKKAAKLDFI